MTRNNTRARAAMAARGIHNNSTYRTVVPRNRANLTITSKRRRVVNSAATMRHVIQRHRVRCCRHPASRHYIISTSPCCPAWRTQWNRMVVSRDMLCRSCCQAAPVAVATNKAIMVSRMVALVVMAAMHTTAARMAVAAVKVPSALQVAPATAMVLALVQLVVVLAQVPAQAADVDVIQIPINRQNHTAICVCSSVWPAAKISNRRVHYCSTIASIPTRVRIHVRSVANVSVNSRIWHNIYAYTQMRNRSHAAIVRAASVSGRYSTNIYASIRVRSPTHAQSAASTFARRPSSINMCAPTKASDSYWNNWTNCKFAEFDYLGRGSDTDTHSFIHIHV